MKLWDRPKKLFKARTPDLSQYKGRTVFIEGKPVVIDTIVGNRFKPTFYEINGTHLLGMLRLHAQMCGDKSITEEQFKAFEQMEVEAEKLPEKGTLIERQKPQSC